MVRQPARPSLAGRSAAQDAIQRILRQIPPRPLRVYDMSRAGDLMRIMRGENIGTLVDIGK
jgi:hypothetical protein